MSRVEAALESLVFRSRWLLAPFFVGLILAIIALLVKFLKQLWALAVGVFDSGEVHADLGTNLARQGRVDEALEQFEAALRSGFDSPTLQTNLGTILMEKNKADAAIEHFKAAVEARPNSPVAQLNWGKLLLRQGRSQEAVPHLREALRLRPEAKDIRARLESIDRELEAGKSTGSSEAR